ncbi:MAG TPA: phosphoglycolate phosphatase [Casimicrobiaceae bacterium]|jgi:phosphoglycolate phosphatase|nr:phosphoglycolate phosphatase [Casimicrobiaceae bacterium]
MTSGSGAEPVRPRTGVSTIVFDLDGTLAHTAPDIVRALNAALVEQGFAALPREAAVSHVGIGIGARRLVERTLRRDAGEPDAAAVEHMVERYLAHYLDAVKVDSTLFPGCVDALDALRARGHRLAVCTNKPERHARLLLDALGIAAHFDAITGFDTYDYRKPDGRHIASTIALAGGDPCNAVMIGDSNVDVAAARDAGVPVVGVTFGYTEQPIATYSPDRMIDHYDELVGAIESLLPEASRAIGP